MPDPVGLEEDFVNHFNRYNYAQNNPVRYTDPDGRCPEGSQITACVESTVEINKEDVRVDDKGDKYASSHAGINSVYSGGAPAESLKAVVNSSDGGLTSKSLANATTSEDAEGYSATGDLPEGALYVMHGHVDNSMVDKAVGLGDSQAALDVGKANVTVTGDKRVGAREIEGKKLQHRMIRGKMTEREAKKIQENMDNAAKIYNERQIKP